MQPPCTPSTHLCVLEMGTSKSAQSSSTRPSACVTSTATLARGACSRTAAMKGAQSRRCPLKKLTSETCTNRVRSLSNAGRSLASSAPALAFHNFTLGGWAALSHGVVPAGKSKSVITTSSFAPRFNALASKLYASELNEQNATSSVFSPIILAATSRQTANVLLCGPRPRMPSPLSRAYCASASFTLTGGMLSAAVFR